MITIDGIVINKFNFPAGEKHVKLEPKNITYDIIYIDWKFENNEEIIELLLVVDALHRLMPKSKLELIMPYVPFARQDRVMVPGEPFSIKVFCDLINSCNFDRVEIWDPHSDITPALLNNCSIVAQEELFFERLAHRTNMVLICPDAGAMKKIFKLATMINSDKNNNRDTNDSDKDIVNIVTCEKIRNVETGEITSTEVHKDDLKGYDCVIVDDICDGGRTFIEIAKILKEKHAGKITLCVTHGIFSKRLKVFDDLIDEIITGEGRVK